MGMWGWVKYGPGAGLREQPGEANRAGGENEHEKLEEGRVVLSEQAIRDGGIEVAEAAGGELEQTLTLPGQIVLNADKVAHIVPRVAGIVHRVDKNLGDEVQAGEIMAILESRELAESKAAYLAAQQKLALAEANLKSAEELHTKRIMPDLEFLTIQKALAEAQIEFKTADNKLHALGVSEEQLKELPMHAASLAMYELRAPFAGTVVEKHCSLGEVLNDEHDAFMLADLSAVWVNVTVYTQYLPLIQVGQPVTINAGPSAGETSAVIEYLSPVVEESTRTAVARVTLPNQDRRWRPGLFVSARVQTSKTPVKVSVPKAAVQTIKSESCVFVKTDDGFHTRPVTLGRVNGSHVEIVAGLTAGERYVSANAFTVKSELEKAGLAEGAGE
jgi:cobalt-zinc-cadmium efflux system membrane fusion protein